MRIVIAIYVLTMVIVFAAFTIDARRNAPAWCEDDPRKDEPVVTEFRADMALIVWGATSDPDDGNYGKASWMWDEELNVTTCKIDAPMPGKVWGDIKMDTFGHEVLHCFTGEFHAE